MGPTKHIFTSIGPKSSIRPTPCHQVPTFESRAAGLRLAACSNVYWSCNEFGQAACGCVMRDPRVADCVCWHPAG